MKRPLLLLLACLSFVWGVPAAVAATPKALTVTEAQFFSGDLPGPLEDAGWERISVPCVPQDCALEATEEIALYRIEFDVADDADLGGWALSRGRVWGAEELYLNGQLVGQTGVIAKQYAQVWAQPRVYSLPSERLTRGTNVVVLRVMDQGLPFGFAFDPVEIGDIHELRKKSDERFFAPLVFQGGTIALSCAGVLVLFLVIVLGGFRNLSVFVILATFCSSAHSWILTAVWFRATPTTTWIESLGYICVLGAAVPLVSFTVLGRMKKWLYWVSGGYLLATAVPLLIAFDARTSAFTGIVQAVYQLTLGLYGGVLLTRESYKQRDPLLGAIAVVVGATLGLVVLGAFWPRTYIYPISEAVQCLVVVVLSMFAIETMRRRTLRVMSLQRQVLEVADEERRKIARELHDSVGQDLQAARMSLQLAARSAPTADGGLKELLNENVSNLGSSLDHIRAVSRQLHPDFAKEEPFKPRLERYAAQLEKLTGRQVKLSWSGEGETPSPNESLHLFRAVQEAVGNALRHGDDDSVDVEAKLDDRSLELAVIGGPTFNHEQAKGIGWETLRERAALLGGAVRLEDHDGRAKVVIETKLQG